MKDKELYDLWNEEQPEISNEAVDYSFKLLLNRINLFEHKRTVRKKFQRRSILGIIAAAVIFIPILVVVLTGPKEAKETYINYLVESAPSGKTRQIVLSDNTIVYLNSKSTLITPSKFVDGERNVYLIGEAYFKVAQNKEKAFKVETRLMKIEALGTEFSVLSYPQNDNVKTTLVEGSVKVEALNNGKLISSKILMPNQQSYFDTSQTEISVEDVNVELYTSWINGKLIFENTPFSAVIERIEIQFDKKIEYSKSLNKYNISAKFVNNESLEEILTLLSEITYSMVEQNNDSYIIKY